MLRYRLLLSYTGLGGKYAHITEALSIQTGTRRRSVYATFANAPIDQHFQAGV